MTEPVPRHAVPAAAVHAHLAGDLADLAVRSFDDATRESWSYLPGERDGIALSALPRRLQVEVLRLLASALRPHAYAQVAAVMALEDVLDVVEGGQGFRHRGDYWLTMFGRPGDPCWGWRFEGHHVSVNVTAVGDDVRGMPLFLGANPAVVRHDEVVISAPLAPEDRLARELLASLDPASRREAVLGTDVPPDLLSEQSSLVQDAPPAGIVAGNLAPPAFDLLQRLVHTYLDRVPEELVATQLAALRGDGWERVRFQWRGSDVPGRPHYYALNGPRLFIEYDDLDGNHVHTVVRDPAGDFGRDLLAEHRAQAHAGPGRLAP